MTHSQTELRNQDDALDTPYKLQAAPVVRDSAQDSSVEIELKLRVPAEALNRFKASPRIRALTEGRATSSTFENVYYDTPDGRLAQKGVALRVRKKNRTYELTAKAKGDRHAGLFKRLEWSTPLSSLAPNFSDKSWPKAFDQTIGCKKIQKALVPRFMISQQRTKRILHLDSTRVEMALDRVNISTPEGQKVNYIEVEFEVLSGTPENLYALAIDLVKSYGLQLSHRSKADEGAALLEPKKPKGIKGKAPQLLSTDTIQTAFQKILRTCAAQMISNEDAIRARTDIEGVHQMRVALRRLRSGFTIFKPVLTSPQAQFMATELKWLSSIFTDARETDVFLTETLPPILASNTDYAGLELLHEEARRLNDLSYETCAQVLGSARYTSLLLHLAEWSEAKEWSQNWAPSDGTSKALLASPIKGFAEQVLSRRHQKVIKLGRKLASLTIERKHDLRLLVKKFRYAGDFFGALYPKKKVHDFNADLAGLQDSLGALNDGVVAGTLSRRLADHVCKNKPEARHTAIEAAGLIIGWQNCTAESRVKSLNEQWRPFGKRAPYWA